MKIIAFLAAGVMGLSGLSTALPTRAAEGSLLDSLENEIVKIVDRSSPAVVSLTTEPLFPGWWKGIEEEQLPAWMRDFFISDFGPRKRRSRGTGFIIDGDGHILTTENVIGEAREVEVALPDGRVFPGRVVGKDELLNLALIKVEAKDLPRLPLGNSEKVKVGSWVITIGHPFGLSASPSWGIVSGRGRSGLGIAPYEELLQITAPVNPGDSGGPVLNSRGEAIGIITASFSGYREFEFDWSFIRRFQQSFPRARWMSPGNFFQPSQAQGISFAIPIDFARKVMTNLEKGGEPVRGWLGIEMEEPAPGEEGLLISAVFPGGPAARAGLDKDARVLSLNGAPLTSARQLQKEVLFSPIGVNLELEVIQRGERKTIPVTIEEQPAEVKEN